MPLSHYVKASAVMIADSSSAAVPQEHVHDQGEGAGRNFVIKADAEEARGNQGR